MLRLRVALGAGLLARLLAIPGAALAAPFAGSVAPVPTYRDDTAALQRAIQACVPGGAACQVRLRRGTDRTRQTFVNGFHGQVIGAGASTTVVEGLPGLEVSAGDPFAHAASARNLYPALLSFGGDSDVSMAGLTIRVTQRTPVPAGWLASRGRGGATWLAAAVYVQGSGHFTRMAFLGGPGADIPGGERTTGVNLDNAVLLRGTGPRSTFSLTRSRVVDTANGFELDGFAGHATVGGSAANGNRFVRSPGGYYADLQGATATESYNEITLEA